MRSNDNIKGKRSHGSRLQAEREMDMGEAARKMDGDVKEINKQAVINSVPYGMKSEVWDK